MFTVCVVNWHSVAYIRFLDFTLRCLAGDTGFRWLICNTESDNTRASDLAQLTNAQVIYRNLDHLQSSVAHGTGFNEIVPHIQTEYALFMDPDSAVLASGWDTICLRELENHHDVVAIGAPYRVPVQPYRYGDYPTVFFVMYKTEFLQQPGIDFRPDWATWRGHARRRLRKFLGLFDSDRDTGWKLRKAAHRQGYRGLCFRWLSCESPEAVVLSNGERGDEYHWRGQPIFSHQGRSRSRVPFQGEISVRWFLAICRYLRLNPAQVDSDLGLNVNFEAVTANTGD